MEAISFKGFSCVDVIQPCIKWGTHPINWYKERIYKLPLDYDLHDREEALKKTREWSERIPIGILHRDDETRKIFGDHFRDKIFGGKLNELDPPRQQTIAQMLESFG